MKISQSQAPSGNSLKTPADTGPIGDFDEFENVTLRVTFLKNWSDYLRGVQGLQERTVTTYRRWIDRLLEQGETELENLGAEHLEKLLRGLALENQLPSMNLARSAARSFGDYLVIRRVRDANPFLCVKAPRTYTKEAPSLTVGEARRLVYGRRPGYLPENPLKARNRVMLSIMYIAGLRVSEPARLRVEKLERTVDGFYSILIEDGKWADEDVRLPILDPIIGLYLAAWVDVLRPRLLDGVPSEWVFPSQRGGRLSDMQVTRVFRSEVKGAGIEPRGRALTPHILRHSIASHLDAAGNEKPFIKDWMRHKSEATTQRYIHPRKAAARDVFRGRRSPLTK